MRAHLPTLLVLLTLAASPLTAAQDARPAATLTIDVGEEEERMTLRLEGLKRLTQYQGICLPQGARETRVYDEVGELQHEARDEDGRRAVSFLARSEWVAIDMRREREPSDHLPVHTGDVNFCVPARASVAVHLRAPEGHTLFFVSDGGAVLNAREARVASDGPVHVFYSYEAPLAPAADVAAGGDATFRVLARAELLDRAEEVAAHAAAPYRAALGEAGLRAPFEPLRVVFQAETPHPWEAGHYGGRGFVTVKEDALLGEAKDGYPYGLVKVLVHEAFHAASFPYGKGRVNDTVAWWLEGTARHAERQVDATMPDATLHCERAGLETRCYDFDDRIRRQDLEAAYGPAFRFDARWEPSAPQTDDTRRFYYAYSEYVVSSWIQRHGVAAYRAAWDEIEAAFLRGEGCPCEDGWLVALLDDERLFEPWSDVRASDPQRFETLVRPFVKDEAALQREANARANPFAGIPAPGAGALLALVALVALARRR